MKPFAALFAVTLAGCCCDPSGHLAPLTAPPAGPPREVTAWQFVVERATAEGLSRAELQAHFKASRQRRIAELRVALIERKIALGISNRPRWVRHGMAMKTFTYDALLKDHLIDLDAGITWRIGDEVFATFFERDGVEEAPGQTPEVAAAAWHDELEQRRATLAALPPVEVKGWTPRTRTTVLVLTSTSPTPDGTDLNGLGSRCVGCLAATKGTMLWSAGTVGFDPRARPRAELEQGLTITQRGEVRGVSEAEGWPMDPGPGVQVRLRLVASCPTQVFPRSEVVTMSRSADVIATSTRAVASWNELHGVACGNAQTVVERFGPFGEAEAPIGDEQGVWNTEMGALADLEKALAALDGGVPSNR